MNLAGKILTFLIFFLSVAFLVLAVMVGNTHQEWKKIANENKTKVTEARTILETYKGKSEEIKKTLNAERVSRRLKLAQLESQLNTFKAAVDSKEKELLERIVTSQRAQDALNNAERRLTELDAQIAEERTKNNSLTDEIAAKTESSVNLTNQIYSLQGQVKELEIARMDIAEELARREKVMNALGISETQLTDQIPPEVEGVVLRTRDNFCLLYTSPSPRDRTRSRMPSSA